MKSIQPTLPGGQLTTGQRALLIERLCDAWADAEAAYEAFLGQYEQIDVLMLPQAEFEQWRGDYMGLYSAVWSAQIAYYQALRAAS